MKSVIKVLVVIFALNSQAVFANDPDPTRELGSRGNKTMIAAMDQQLDELNRHSDELTLKIMDRKSGATPIEQAGEEAFAVTLVRAKR